MQFGLFVVDLLGLTFFLLLHCVPHRAFTMWRDILESSEAHRANEIIRKIESILHKLDKRTLLIDHSLWYVEDRVKQGDRNCSSFAPIERYLVELYDAAKTLEGTLENPESGKIVMQMVADEHELQECHSMFLTERLRLLLDKPDEHPITSGLAYLRSKQVPKPTNTTQPTATTAAATKKDDEEKEADNDDEEGEDAEEDQPLRAKGLAEADSSEPYSYERFASKLDDINNRIATARSNLIRIKEQKRQEFRQMPWKCNLDIDRAKAIIFSNTAQFAYDLIAVLCFVAVMCTVYRAPTLITTVSKSHDKRKTCLWNFAQIFIDISYLLKYLLVCAAIRHLGSMHLDMVVYWGRKPSFKILRRIIDHYVGWVIVDIFCMLSFFTAWRTYKFAVATTIWGAFAPAVLIDQGLHLDKFGKFIAVTSIMGLCALLYGYPIFYANKLSQQPSVHWPGLYAYFALLAMWLLAGLIFSFRDHFSGATSAAVRKMRFPPVKYLALNWTNAMTYLGIILETLQWCGLLWMVNDIEWEPAGFRQLLRKIGSVVWGSIGIDRPGALGLPIGFWLSVGLSGLYYVLAALPVVLEDILEWRRSGEVSTWRPWLLTTTLLSQWCFPFIVYNLSSVLFGDPAQWSDAAFRKWARISMLLLVFYIPTASMKDRKHSERSRVLLDIQWLPCATTLTCALHGVLVVLCAAFHPSRANANLSTYVTVVLTMVSVFLMTFLMMPKLLGTPACSVATVYSWRVMGCLFAWIFTLVMAANHFMGQDGFLRTTPITSYVVCGAAAACFLIGALRSVLLHRVKLGLDVTLHSIQKDLLDTEQAAYTGGFLSPSWHVGESARWRRDVGSTSQVEVLSRHLLHFENHVRLFAYTPLLLGTRKSWRETVETFRASSNIDFDAFVTRFEDEYWDDFCDCCPRSYYYYYWWHRNRGNAVNVVDFESVVPAFSESVQTLINGLRFEK